MKILHFGDVHYEEAKHRRTASDGIDQGWHDVANAVDELVDRAIAEQVSVVAFGGDLARSRKPSPQTYAHFAAALGRLQAAGIRTVAIPGNHDIASNGEANALDPLAHLPGVHLFNEPGIAWIHDRYDDGAMPVFVRRGSPEHPLTGAPPAAAVVCVPWLQRSVAAANLPADASLEQVLGAMSTAAMAIIRDLATEQIAAGVPTMLLYHGTVMGGTTATGQLASLFHEPVLSAVDLDQLGLAGVMLNHLHRRQDLAADTPGATPIVYSSSVERLTFGDETDTKGGVLWTVPEKGYNPSYHDAPRSPDVPAPDRATYEWIDTAARPFITVTEPEGIDYAGAEPVVEGAIMRVRIPLRALDEPGPAWDPVEVERALLDAGAHRVTEVVIEADDARVEHAAADLARTSPVDALRDWLTVEHPDAAEEWVAAVLADAQHLVMGETPMPEVPALPTTDAEFAALPVLDLDDVPATA